LWNKRNFTGRNNIFYCFSFGPEYKRVASGCCYYDYIICHGEIFAGKVGGATGDILGAVCELNQTFFLILFYLFK